MYANCSLKSFAIDESSLDKNILNSEKDIYKQELDKLDKKEDIKRNILEGKMKKVYK